MVPRWPWPALENRPWTPAALSFERGIWGKVRGSVVDFGWIARSAGVERAGEPIQRHFVLGAENVMPPRAPFWRRVGARYVAASCYPSTAVDAGGRNGLEKQFLTWEPAGAPAALGALLLLPAAAQLETEAWLQAAGSALGKTAGDVIMPSPEPIDVDGVAEAIERGRRCLQKRFEKADPLVAFYESLLRRRKPAVLSGLDRPLSPEALAALLLPLPPALADTLSLAGWIIPESWEGGNLARSWDVIVCQVPPSLPCRSRRESDLQRRWYEERAKEMADRLL
jgi:hypothetical protein